MYILFSVSHADFTISSLAFRHRWFGNHGGPYYPAFWSFSPAGLSIYSVEGDLMKSIPNNEICQTRESCSSSTKICGRFG